ncbi:MAG: PhaM family polyhydroxyalkanoate granule multifunctional regulatory protein [Rubrivivax sp.]
MAPAHDFSKMVPGFDFLQGLVKNASSALPSLGQWVAPTLDPEELAKRIEELKTVQFWLEQNARMIGTTVQALEVQRMTLTTLKTMNVQVADLAQAFKLQDPVPASAASFVTPPAAAPAAAPSPAPADTAASKARARRGAGSSGRAAPSPAGAAPGVVDPLQWWGALTQQFTQLAAQALKDRPADGASGASGTTSAAGPATATSAAAGKDAAGASRKGPGGAARKATPGSRSAHAGRSTTSSTAPKSAPRQASRKA